MRKIRQKPPVPNAHKILIAVQMRGVSVQNGCCPVRWNNVVPIDRYHFSGGDSCCGSSCSREISKVLLADLLHGEMNLLTEPPILLQTRVIFVTGVTDPKTQGPVKLVLAWVWIIHKALFTLQEREDEFRVEMEFLGIPPDDIRGITDNAVDIARAIGPKGTTGLEEGVEFFPAHGGCIEKIVVRKEEGRIKISSLCRGDVIYHVERIE